MISSAHIDDRLMTVLIEKKCAYQCIIQLRKLLVVDFDENNPMKKQSIIYTTILSLGNWSLMMGITHNSTSQIYITEWENNCVSSAIPAFSNFPYHITIILIYREKWMHILTIQIILFFLLQREAVCRDMDGGVDFVLSSIQRHDCYNFLHRHLKVPLPQTTNNLPISLLCHVLHSLPNQTDCR